MLRLTLLVAASLSAFAANSLLCRKALASELIDPVSFTTIRILSGAVVLFLLVLSRGKIKSSLQSGSWLGAALLIIYALTFSLGYISLDSGTGALILFGLVQVTMIVSARRSGERLGLVQYSGLGIAIIGLTYLLLPGVTAPNPTGALLMAASGLAWALYTLAGKTATNPMTTTFGNFLRAAPLALIASLVTLSQVEITSTGLILGTLSGGITSGLGYILWYSTLPKLSTTQASILQTLTPPLTSLAGIIFLNEVFTARLGISSALILAGVLLALLANKKK